MFVRGRYGLKVPGERGGGSFHWSCLGEPALKRIFKHGDFFSER